MAKWITFKLQGMTFKLKCWGYSKEVGWLKTSFRFKFGDAINYKKDNDEIFTPECVDILIEHLNKLIDGKWKREKELSFFEPDFVFVFHPEKEIECVGKTYQQDISLDLHVNLWDGGLTSNYFSMSFEREDIVRLRDYFKDVAKGN